MSNNYKIWIILSLVTIFIAGIVCGILLEKHVLDKHKKRTERKRSSAHFPSLEMMAEELSLTSEQQEKIRGLFSGNEESFRSLRREIHDRLASIRTQMITDIESVLDEEQNRKFDAMIEKYKARIKREHEKRRRKADSPQGNREDEK